MIVQELLDELRDGYLRDRSGLISGTSDGFWSDTSLVRYIDNAQKRFARLTLCLHDGTTEKVTAVALQTGVDVYELDSSVLGVISVRYQDDVFDLPRIGHSIYTIRSTSDQDYFDVAQLTPIPSGKPIAFSTDEYVSGTIQQSTVNLRVFPTPTATYDDKIVRLRVVRMPLDTLDLSSADSQEPEIPEEYHLDLLDWAAYRALRNIDADVGNFKSADLFKKRFDEAVKEASSDIRRKLFTPMRWHFGDNGFSWVK